MGEALLGRILVLAMALMGSDPTWRIVRGGTRKRNLAGQRTANKVRCVRYNTIGEKERHSRLNVSTTVPVRRTGLDQSESTSQ
jgi:hypothetical protein